MGTTDNGYRRFGDFEFDAAGGKLFHRGHLVKIQPQPLRVLEVLVRRSGEIVSREELRSQVWDASTYVEFDQGLNYCIRQIRVALRDDAAKPLYIETLPRQGYRFITEVTGQPRSETADPERAITTSVNGIVESPLEAFETSESSETIDAPSRAAEVIHAPTQKGHKWQLATIAAVLASAAAGLWWMMADRRSAGPFPLQVTHVSKLTSYPGDERDPAISPDGAYVAFSWSGATGDNYDIYVTQTDGQQPLRLTRDPAPDSFPAWSPDGHQIAFIRRNGDRAEIILVAPLGGPERKLHEFFRSGADLDFTQHPVLNWSQDGKSILFSAQSKAGEKYQLFLFSVETGAVRAISSPDRDISGDSSPALSANDRSLAFVRYLAPRNGRILIQPLGPGMVPRGELAEVPNSGLGVHSPVWLDDDKQLLFADSARIYQWDRKKGTVPIYAFDGVLGGMSVGPKKSDNSRQAVIASEKKDSDIWSVSLAADGARSTSLPEVFLRSTASDSHPDFSPDGRHIVFISARSGAPEVWVCDADGANLRQLTHLGAYLVSYPKWSPDGSRIAFHARVPDIAEVYVVDVDQGTPRQVTHENPGLALATWSNDGRSLYASTLVGGRAVTYRFPVGGGPLERLWEGSLLRESVDGKYALYLKSNIPGIFRRSLQGDVSKNPEELLVRDFWPNNQLGGYAPVATGIYYVSGNAQGRSGPFRYFDYLSRKSIDVAPSVPGLQRGFTISPDQRRMLFAASAEIGGDLLSFELR